MIHSLTLKNACISTSSRTKSCSTQQASKNYVIMVIMLAMANVQHGNPLDPHKIVRYVRHQLDCRKECKENDRIDRRTETGVMVTCQYKEKSA